MITVYLKQNEHKKIRGGFGWVYANEVYKIEGKDKNGSLATVRSFDGRFIGKGYINYLSKILVRIFIFNDEDENTVIYQRILRAVNTRKQLSVGSCYRAVFAEADMLPGVIVDVYGDCVSLQILTLGAENKKSVIVDAIKDILSPRTIVERSDVAVREKEGLNKFKGVIYGEQVESTVVEENGLKIKVDLLNGQKTGYFLDQKFNRLAVRRYVKGKTVLDCFSNAGGFALNAAAAGAKSVTALDISPVAIEEINFNAKLNGLSVEAVCCDVFDKLREYKAENRKFDVIILDPP
ncbi:MAG: class I SAM-dependent rRNA methyltransferase, partial [Clostridia bacterium]|nr:class I SAM-dependent rRNA methyltransferase [Clostridia bacterium]